MEKKYCNKTGLPFNAKSSRQKNHPEVSKILTEAHGARVYKYVVEACELIKEQSTTEDEALAFLNGVLNEKSEERLNEIFAKKQERKDFWKWLNSQPYSKSYNSDNDYEDGDENFFRTDQTVNDTYTKNDGVRHDM